jgi:haloalkane dehalogenase
MEKLFLNSRIRLAQGLLFWREAGRGVPIIFVHGAWADSSEWVPAIDNLLDDYHCFAVDLLGFGESETENINHAIDIHVETLAELLTKLKLEKVYLVGHSLGGWIAASFTLKYPEMIHGLVLLAPEGVATEGVDKNWKDMQKILKRSDFMFSLLKWLRPILSIFGLDSKVDQEWKLRKKIEPFPVSCQLLFQRREAEIEAELLQNRLYSIECPVLILQGGKDSPEAITSSQTYAQLISNALFKMIAHGSDNLPETCTGVVAGEIRDFIRGEYE